MFKVNKKENNVIGVVLVSLLLTLKHISHAVCTVTESALQVNNYSTGVTSTNVIIIPLLIIHNFMQVFTE